MKKELLALFVLVFIVLIFILTPSITSASVELFCSDNSKILSELNEVEIGSYRMINDLGIGVTKTSESVFYKRITADLLVDTKRTILSNKSSETSPSSETVSLLSGDYTITFVKTNSTTATITVGGETISISKLETTSVKGIFAMLTDITSENDNPTIKVIMGAKQLSLSSEKSAEKIVIGNKTYVVELSSASQTNALIKVSKCSSGEIMIKGQETDEKPINRKPTPEIRIPEPNESTVQVSVAEFNARKRNQSLQSNQTAEQADQDYKQKRFFTRIWNWIKKLFGFREEIIVSNNLSNMTDNLTVI